ncbi:MAG: hypothetical protein IPP56_03945 [Bacteroidetes bacterium]|nr:hypothetical protein [Bacteroidota bacterium]MBK9798902.1 hypothetical protein [Bacteroidota bacterium]
MLQSSSHIVLLSPGFAADESDVNCISYLQYFLLHLKEIAPEKKYPLLLSNIPLLTSVMFGME